MNHINYDINKYSEDINTLVQKIKAGDKKYDFIVGVVRGGCIPGVHLSNILDIPFVPLMWSHSRNDKDKNLKILLDKQNNCLVVDDILDEGTTMSEINQHYGDNDTAVLIYNCINRFNLVPTFSAWTINRETLPNWFDFWWEK